VSRESGSEVCGLAAFDTSNVTRVLSREHIWSRTAEAWNVKVEAVDDDDDDDDCVSLKA
jgi:hypothetical protein